MNRIIGAFSFRQQVYAEVERDAGFTNTAWIVVVVANFVGQIGVGALNGFTDPVQWIQGVIVGTLLAIATFVVGVEIVDGVGREAFGADVSLEALVRTLGLASVWSAVGVVGVLAVLSTSLTIVGELASSAAAVLGMSAWLLAAKATLKLEWLPVVITVVVAWIVCTIILVLAGIFLALFGFNWTSVLP